MHVNSFDIDGVIDLEGRPGVYPGPNDVIITGRSYEEAQETLEMLEKMGINNTVCFNPLPFNQKTRVTSGKHKARILNELALKGVIVAVHFEDDEVQVTEISRLAPQVVVVHLRHSLVNPENTRRLGVENPH